MKNNAFVNHNLSQKWIFGVKCIRSLNEGTSGTSAFFFLKNLLDKFQVNKSIIFMKIDCFDRFLKHSALVTKGRELMLGVHFSALHFENRPL